MKFRRQLMVVLEHISGNTVTYVDNEFLEPEENRKKIADEASEIIVKDLLQQAYNKKANTK